MKKTKIICTMGPNADKRETLKALVENGMDIARFNFSHGDHEEQKARFDLLKSVRDEMKKPIAILLDTKGPEIRTGLLENGGKVNLFTRPRRFGVENIRVYGIAFCEKRRRVVTALMEPQSGEKDPGGRKSFRVFE